MDAALESDSLTLPWGQETLTLDVPAGWRVADTLEPASQAGVADADEEVARSLSRPIGSQPLSELVVQGARVVVVIDDASRPTPVKRLLPAVVRELEAGGVRREDVTVVTALGVHRPMTEEEVVQRAGPLVTQGLRWENHDCDAVERLAHLGTTRRGTEVFVNRTVAEADVVVSIGCIEPHLIASFGGGYKNLIPGVAGRETIGHNHALNARPQTFNMVGQPISNNPMRLDLEEGCHMIKAPVFIVNAVLNSALDVVQVVSGDPIAAHREGARVSASIYGARVEAPADVVMASSHPMDQDLRQGSKALANTIRAVRRGGTQIILMRAEEGLGVFGLADRKLPLGRGGLRLLAPLLVRLIPRLKLGDMPHDQRFYLYFALQSMRHCTTIVYAPTVPVEARAGLPFVVFVDSVEEALALARQRHPDAQVLVFPHGGSTYPVLA
ncbi:MAG: nickel-dependent lactate racemase [Anaerolineae bacterium]